MDNNNFNPNDLNNNKSEYDYTDLYNGPQPNAAQSAPQSGAYHFAGDPQKSEAQPTGAAGAYQQAAATQNTAWASGQNGYAQQPYTPPMKKKTGNGKKVALRVVSMILLVAVCAGAGFGGGYLGSRVVTQQALAAVSQAQSAMTTQTNNSQSAITNNAANLSISEISAKCGPSVVAITATYTVSNGFFGSSQTGTSAGSGVIYSEDGYILTNAHVVDGARDITVTTEDGKGYSASLVGEDTTVDVAVLKINASGLSAAAVGDSDSLAVGDTVVAIGNPLGTLSGTVTSGIVSALNREVNVEGISMRLIQTSASVNQGNSGGGLFNDNGQLIGIVNAGASSAEGIGFAIPINTFTATAQDIIENGHVTTRPVMGVTVITISDAQTAAQYGVGSFGVYIQDVTAGGGADLAGLQAGDMFISIDDKTVTDSNDLTNILAGHAAGDVLEVQVARERSIISVKLTLQAAL